MRVTSAMSALLAGGRKRWLLGACALALAHWVSAAPGDGGEPTPPPPPAWSLVFESGPYPQMWGQHNAVAKSSYLCPTGSCEVIGVATSNFGPIEYIESHDGGGTWYGQGPGASQGGATGDLDLAAFAGRPFIVFERSTANEELWLSWRPKPLDPIVGNCLVWHCVKLGNFRGYRLSIDVDNAGVVFVAATTQFGTIEVFRIPPPYTAPVIAGYVPCALPCDKPRWIRIAVDDESSPRVHLAWSRGTKLEYASAWASQNFGNLSNSVDVLDTYPLGGPDDGLVGMAIDVNGLPHIAYTSLGSSGRTVVRHAQKLNQRPGDWVNEHVSTLVAGLGGTGVGSYGVGDPFNRVDIELDSYRQTSQAITFGRSSTAGLQSFAIARPSTLGAGWVTSTIDSGGAAYGAMIRLRGGKLLVADYGNYYNTIRILREN